MKSTPLNIALAFDRKLYTPFFVVLTSLFDNNKGSTFCIHTIATGVSEEQKDRITAFVKQNQSEINFYEITSSHTEGLIVPENTHLALAAYYRLFFPSLIPSSITKLLYMDSDIVILDSLKELYETDLGSYPFGAKTEVNATKNRPDLGIYEDYIYFNSGIMLMNIPEWKAQRITEKCIQFIRDYPEKILYMDQDALNVVAGKNYYRLDSRFNVLPSDIPKDISGKEAQDFLKNKVIMHYTCADYKPWSIFSIHPYNYIYKAYFNKSPQSHEKMITDIKITPRFVMRLAYSRIKRPLVRRFPTIGQKLKVVMHSLVLLLDI